MKRLIIRGGLFIVLLLIPILFVDYYVDAYASFRLTYDEIGRIGLESNYSVGDDIPLSERKPKWAKLIRMNPVENIVLGSSKSMLFSSENLGIDSFYNLAVSGGNNIKDYYAEIYILYQNNKLPNKMLIEIPPSLFNGSYSENRFTEWGNNSEYMKDTLSGKECHNNDTYLLGIQITDLLSPAYFKYNLQQLLKGNRTYIKIHDSFDDERLATQHIDGSFAYSKEFLNKRNEEKIISNIRWVGEQRKIRGCSDFIDIDSGILTDFEKLISFLTNQGVNVSFYLPPYTEELYEYIRKDNYYHSILDVENYILVYSKNNNMQLYGSYNPDYCGITVKDLIYDEYHINAERVLDTLWPRNPKANYFWVEHFETWPK